MKKQRNKIIDICQQLYLSVVRAQISLSKLDRTRVQKKNKRKRKQTTKLFFFFLKTGTVLKKNCRKCVFKGLSVH